MEDKVLQRDILSFVSTLVLNETLSFIPYNKGLKVYYSPTVFEEDDIDLGLYFETTDISEVVRNNYKTIFDSIFTHIDGLYN